MNTRTFLSNPASTFKHTCIVAFREAGRICSIRFFIVCFRFFVLKFSYPTESKRLNTFAQYAAVQAFGSDISEGNLRLFIVSRTLAGLYHWLFLCTSPSKFFFIWSLVRDSSVASWPILSKRIVNNRCLINDRSILSVYGVVYSAEASAYFPLPFSSYLSHFLQNEVICVGFVEGRLGAAIGVNSATCAWSAASSATLDVPRLL